MKRRKLFFRSFGVCVLAILMSGCGKAKKIVNINELGQGCTIVQSGSCAGEDGILVLENGGLVAFYDPKTEVYLPLCNKPNCKHESGSCAAVELAANADWIGYHKGLLYYSSSKENGETELYSAEMNGENVKQMGTYSHRMTWGKKIFYEGKLYLATNDDIFTEEGDYNGVYTVLLEIDLESGKETPLTEEIRYGKPGYDLLGICEGMFYYIDYTDGNKLTERDLRTGNSQVLEQNVLVANLDEDILFYCTENGTAYEKDLKGGSQRFIGNGIIMPNVWNRHIRIAAIEDGDYNGYYRWDEENGFSKIASFQAENGFVYYAGYGDYLLGSYGQKFSRIKEADYLSGTWEAEILEITGNG